MTEKEQHGVNKHQENNNQPDYKKNNNDENDDELEESSVDEVAEYFKSLELNQKQKEDHFDKEDLYNDNPELLLEEDDSPHLKDSFLSHHQCKPILKDPSLRAIAEYIQKHKVKKIIIMTGAGVSTSAGIPDFRTKGTGLYDNLAKYALPYPEAVFDISYFRKNPKPFYLLAKELYPGNFKPTLTHCFIKLLVDKGLVLRNYTQNIDTLERVAGIDGQYLVEAHGSFSTASCVGFKRWFSIQRQLKDENSNSQNIGVDLNREDCGPSNSSSKPLENHDQHYTQNDKNSFTEPPVTLPIQSMDQENIKPTQNNSNSINDNGVDDDNNHSSDSSDSIESDTESVTNYFDNVPCGKIFSQEWVKQQIFKDLIPQCPDCRGLVKPDITFFGENLPKRFYQLLETDFSECDLLIVMGTSLQVQPFASLIDYVQSHVPRLLINLECVGDMGAISRGFDFSWRIQSYKRDVFYASTCDDGCFDLAELLGFQNDLLNFHASFSA